MGALIPTIKRSASRRHSEGLACNQQPTEAGHGANQLFCESPIQSGRNSLFRIKSTIRENRDEAALECGFCMKAIGTCLVVRAHLVPYRFRRRNNRDVPAQFDARFSPSDSPRTGNVRTSVSAARSFAQPSEPHPGLEQVALPRWFTGSTLDFRRGRE